MIGVAATVFEAAKVRIAHQADIAGLRALDNDFVIFIQMFALVDEFQVLLRTASLTKAEQYHASSGKTALARPNTKLNLLFSHAM